MNNETKNESRLMLVAGLESFYFGLITSELKQRAAKPLKRKNVFKEAIKISGTRGYPQVERNRNVIFFYPVACS